MKIAYCTNVRLPSERAHGHQVAQVCEALIRLGHEVTVFAPFRRNPVTDNFHAYYNVDRKIEMTHLGSFDPINRWWLPGVTGLWVLNALLRRNLSGRIASFDLLYTRSPALLSTLVASDKRVILELHQLPRLNRYTFVQNCNQCHLVVCLTSAMREELISWGVSAEKVIVEGDGVDRKRFENLPSMAEARAFIGLQTDRKVIGYVGRLKTLGMEKGVKYILEALKQLQSEKRFMGLIVGGPEKDTAEYRKMAEMLGLTADDVMFTGDVPASKVPMMLTACDVLAMPFPDLPHYRSNMSPLKMFEYMAANRPIITTDLPTIRDVLSEETAYFCQPGDTQSLAASMTAIAANPAEAQQKAQKALSLVQRYTWEERMKRILSTATVKA